MTFAFGHPERERIEVDYSNATEMVRDAVRRMREHDDQHGRLLASLEIGERDIAAGRTVPYTPGLLSQIEQEARTHAANNRPTNPDVTDSPHLIK